MKHLDFIIWLCLFPLVSAMVDAIRWQWCERKDYSENVQAWTSITILAFYLIVAAHLYR